MAILNPGAGLAARLLWQLLDLHSRTALLRQSQGAFRRDIACFSGSADSCCSSGSLKPRHRHRYDIDVDGRFGRMYSPSSRVLDDACIKPSLGPLRLAIVHCRLQLHHLPRSHTQLPAPTVAPSAPPRPRPPPYSSPQGSPLLCRLCVLVRPAASATAPAPDHSRPTPASPTKLARPGLARSPPIVLVVASSQRCSSLQPTGRQLSSTQLALPPYLGTLRPPPRLDVRRLDPRRPSQPAAMCQKFVHTFSCGHQMVQKAECATSRSTNCGVLQVKNIKHDEKCDSCDH
ncbi:uncharacterized protein BDZ99DRAFT_521952 [Mytilinidion resinicola]|uniref:Uncharacterized protein n=1 Tax=Mytilinidion resinicola TaxID=574789 RepID=A0A6A6YKJ0_9PEZI|nr:uncharacterized protein BDZ99DRAFT_521952 [Mytilinidion resinicola]KAF2808397.1 hypothetical protein BDZ99DRAFT_521952 [Mytilinidion resinicola]